MSTSASGDELNASLAQARPDPLLGEFVTEPPPGSAQGGETSGRTRKAFTDPGPDFEEGVLGDHVSAHVGPGLAGIPHEPAGATSRDDTSSALASLQIKADDISDVPVDPSLINASAESLAVINVGAPSPSAAGKVRRGRKPPVEDDEEDEMDDLDDHAGSRGSSLLTLLLASYASAVTIGLIWVLWTGRRVKERAEPDFLPPADTRPDPGVRADQSRRITSPPPIAAEHLAGLGETVRLGFIEATPLSIKTETVRLEREFTEREVKSGGKNALKLLLKLRNVSTDTVLAPLDEAFVRQRIRADPDSFIETSDGGETIAMYPLAVESEWGIVGQEFRELKPGEEFETEVVSVPNAVSRKTPEMTWRVRLRTDLNHTDDLGVRFRQDEITPGR